MTLPIVAYGAAVLRKVSEPIDAAYPNLAKLIEDMWETMYDSNGVGLAAPQINRAIRLFVMDSQQIFENAEPGDETYSDAPGIKRVFINAKIIKIGAINLNASGNNCMLKRITPKAPIFNNIAARIILTGVGAST